MPSRDGGRRRAALSIVVHATGGRGENTKIRAIDSKCRAMRSVGDLRRSCGGHRPGHETEEGAEAVDDCARCALQPEA